MAHQVARPDGQVDDLGLKMLDEPAAKQSDPTVLNLQLRQVSKQANLKPVEVTSVETSDRGDQVRVGPERGRNSAVRGQRSPPWRPLTGATRCKFARNGIKIIRTGGRSPVQG